ncbi:hypothetical protein NIES30_19980 [Phormidium tenue NIES-30]|uniref:Uncharacterized protein n=1 Tax=Phormidium tenue NIES-30 TaxID=549789 RepID=A0A1U7J0V4_9CYAN|nr:hypothetical protein NIES30_19980 [Phormidium tenue NIES-30]
MLYNAEEALDQPFPPASNEWEAVTFPGQMPLDHAVELAEVYGLFSPTAADSSTEAAPPAEPAPEDLVQLIQDLNQCNDALLLRVTELEEALERSQVALQAEIERTHPLGGLPVGATPGPVQQQIAQLLSELDIANDGLRRTTIHNETLQAELESNQQRVAQLERECTLLQQRFGEKNTALHQAEETCRDLKARLHRQQRYTLQFKAALEKCLNMAPATGSAIPSSTAVQGQLLSPTVLEEANQPVAMPRSQQIQPWSASQGSVTDNPSLTHLLRGLRSAGPSSVPAPTATQPERLPSPEPSTAIAPDPLPTVPAPPLPLADPNPAPVALDPWLEAADLPTTTTETEAASLFTEPSPWGEPVAAVPQPAPASSPAATTVSAEPVQTPQPAAPAPSPSQPAASSLPSYSYAVTAPKASPSPLVYPLRSQKKITSISAVELPSFGRAVRRRTV